MSPLDLIGLLASLVILACYALSVREGNARVFHWANAVLWIPVALPAVLAGVWGAFLLTTSFGLIGTFALVVEAQDRREDERAWRAVDRAWRAVDRWTDEP